MDHVALRRRLAQRYLSDLQARVFEVEVALDAAHDLIPDPALALQAQHGFALRLQKLALEALEGRRACLKVLGVAVGFEVRGEVRDPFVGGTGVVGGAEAAAVAVHPSTRKIGYGTSRTSESNTRPATATSNPKTTSSK